MHIARLFLACHVQRMIRRSTDVGRTSSRPSLVFLYLSTYQRPLMSSDVMALTSDKPQHEYELSLADLGLIKTPRMG